jgi:protein involved in polysaccharide export with SLBB domain
MKNRYILYFAFIFWICSGFYVSAQQDEITTTRQASNADANQNIMLARSSDDYRVTPGDVYTLAYSAGSTPVKYTITVDTSYRIRVSNLGIINGRGKTFLQLKSEAEAIVANNHMFSGVQLILTQPGIFRVHIKGEVYTSGEVSAWGLSRLSSLINSSLIIDTNRNATVTITNYTSIRDISVKSSNGQTRVYDLFKAQRLGDLNEDPYLRPGDVITFNRIKRVVTINGGVERPGAYQLMDGENLKELIGFYANGFTPVADTTRATLTRYVDSKEISGDVTLLSEQDFTGNYSLKHLDVISIPLITELRPVVPVNRIERMITIYGAVRRPGVYTLMPHENLKELIEVYADGITTFADKTGATLTRYTGSKEISGDVIPLSEQDFTGNYPLLHLDVIAIPPMTGW